MNFIGKHFVIILSLLLLSSPVLFPMDTIAQQGGTISTYDLYVRSVDQLNTSFIDFEYEIDENREPNGLMTLSTEDDDLIINIIISSDFDREFRVQFNENTNVIRSPELGDYKTPFFPKNEFTSDSFHLEGNSTHPYYFRIVNNAIMKVLGDNREVLWLDTTEPVPEYITKSGGKLTLRPNYNYDAETKVLVSGDLSSPIFYQMFDKLFLDATFELKSTILTLGEPLNLIDFAFSGQGVNKPINFLLLVFVPTLTLMFVYRYKRKNASKKSSSFKDRKEQERLRRKRIKQLRK